MRCLFILFFCFVGLFFHGAFAQNSSKTDFDVFFSIISSKNFFKLTKSDFDEKIKSMCQESLDYDSYKCNKNIGVDFMELSGDPRHGFLKTAFYDIEKCKIMENILTNEFGRPQEKKDECNMRWSLPAIKGHDSRRHVSLQLGKKTTLIYYSIGSDQM
jgi:hypothetical protein